MRRGWLAGVAVLFLGFAALAEKEELVDRARKLIVEARPFIDQANDTDLSLEERKTPRRDAYQRLKEARGLFDQYLDLNHAMEDKLDKEYVELNVLIYGLRKDSAIGELDKEKDAPPELPPVGGGSGPPVTGPTGPTGTAPAGTAPAIDPAAAKAQLAALVAFDAQHAGDLALLQQMYEKFLRDFGDPSLPEYGTAAKRLGEINERIRAVFLASTHRDVDSLARADTDEKKAVPARLCQDFNEHDVEVRRRAAHLLASMRSGAATYFLAKGLRDKDEEVEKTCKEGLVAIGGTRAGVNLCGFYLGSSHENRLEALDVMYRIFAKSEGDALTIGPFIGQFGLLNDGPVALAALKFLKDSGPRGGPGLMAAMATRDWEKKCWLVDALVKANYVKCVARLGGWLMDGREYAGMRSKAMNAIPQFGSAAVPYLFPHLAGSTSLHANLLLHQMCPAAPESINSAKEWKAWWAENDPEDPGARK